MNYTISSEPFEKVGNRIKSQLTEKVTIRVEGYKEPVVYHQLHIVQPVLGHHQFNFLWKLGDGPRMSYQDQASVIRKYLGKKVTVALKDTLTGIQVNFAGLITEMHVNEDDGGTKGFTVIGHSPTLLMDDIPQSQTYLKKNLKDVITAATSDAPSGLLPAQWNAPLYNDSLPYIVQYNETDFAFLQRLAVRYGEWFFYDGERLVFGPTLRTNTQLLNGVNLHNFTIRSGTVTQKVAFTGYDHQQANGIEQLLLSYQSNTKSQFARDAVQSAGGLFQRSNKNKRYVAHAANANELKHIEQLYQQAQEARALTYSGVSKLPLQVGGLVSISKDKVESLFLVTKATHESNLFGHYECHFESIPYDVKVPHYTNPFITKPGESQPAKVTANNDPKGMGRVIVEFHWGYKTDWIRMVQPHGGSGKGFYFIPEVGEEVLVGFEGGNVEKPYILGTKYNGKELSGYGGTANNDLKVIQTRSGTKIKLNDAEGSIFIEDPSGNTWFMDGQGNIEVRAPKNIDMFAGENMTVQVGNTMTFNVGNQAILNIMQKMLVNTPFMQQLIADYFHTQAGKALLNSENEIKIESPDLYVAGQKKLFLHSDETATLNSEGSTEVKGKQGNIQNNQGEAYESAKPEITAKCVVQFRPHNNWTGEFGFDWMRMGDTGKGGDTWYRDIIGRYRNASGALQQIYSSGVFKQEASEYTNLMKEFRVLSIPWKKDFYITPMITLYPGAKAKFSLKIEIEEEPKELKFDYDKTLFSLNKATISQTSKGKHTLPDYVEVSCLKEFSNHKYIDVIAVSNNGDEHMAGRLRIHKNDKLNRYKAKVVFVKVWTDLRSSGTINKATTIGEKTFLEKYLTQSLVKTNVIEDKLDLSTDAAFNSTYSSRGNIANASSGVGIHTYLKTQFDKNTGDKYKDYYQVFFINERYPISGGLVNGSARNIPSKEVVVYNTHNPSTTTHELLHAMGLYHSFDNDSKFTFEQLKTDNIMDYSHQVSIDRISTWQWQWQKVWNNVEKE